MQSYIYEKKKTRQTNNEDSFYFCGLYAPTHVTLKTPFGSVLQKKRKRSSEQEKAVGSKLSVPFSRLLQQAGVAMLCRYSRNTSTCSVK